MLIRIVASIISAATHGRRNSAGPRVENHQEMSRTNGLAKVLPDPARRDAETAMERPSHLLCVRESHRDATTGGGTPVVSSIRRARETRSSSIAAAGDAAHIISAERRNIPRCNHRNGLRPQDHFDAVFSRDGVDSGPTIGVSTQNPETRGTTVHVVFPASARCSCRWFANGSALARDKKILRPFAA